MLIVYEDQNDGTGRITQCIVQAQVTLEVLAQKYTEQNINNILYDGSGDISSLYVKNVPENPTVVPKEPVTVTGDIRQIQADGSDALSLTVAPVAFTLYVTSSGKLIHQERVTDGQLEFSVDHPGTYTIIVDPGHPYLQKQFDIVAVTTAQPAAQ